MSTTAREIYDQQNPREFTPSEAAVFFQAEPALKNNGFDCFTERGKATFIKLFRDYYNANRQVPVTLKGVYDLVEANKNSLPSVTPAQKDFYLAHEQNPTGVTAISAWLATQGKAGQLEKAGDAGLVNAVQLLRELKDREINATTIFQAQQRLANRPDGGKLVWIPVDKPANPYQHKAEDIKGNDRVNWTPKDYKKEQERLEAEAAKASQPTPEQALDHQSQFYKFTIERHLEFGNHAENEAIRSLHKRLVSDGASLKTQYETLAKEVDYYTKRAQVTCRSLR